MDTRRRLRKIFHDRARTRVSVFHTPETQVVRGQQIRLCQNLAENGFDDLRPEHWDALGFYGLVQFLVTLQRLLREWSLEPPSRPWRAI